MKDGANMLKGKIGFLELRDRGKRFFRGSRWQVQEDLASTYLLHQSVVQTLYFSKIPRSGTFRT